MRSNNTTDGLTIKNIKTELFNDIDFCYFKIKIDHKIAGHGASALLF
jgi:hypothetical protein